jgi:DNA-binding response OmpR family regulator
MMTVTRSTQTMKKILLVDDDPELRQLLATYLGRHGFDTLLLPDTRQLDAFLERYQPQLMVLDLMLPGEDGLAACRRLRARGETRPIIMLTARDETVDRVIGLETGADDYVGKPFDPRELVARIEAVLRRGARPPAAPDPAGGRNPFRQLAFRPRQPPVVERRSGGRADQRRIRLAERLGRQRQSADEARAAARIDARRDH